MRLRIYLIILFCLLLISAALQLNAQGNSKYLVGYGKADITYVEEDLGLFGYGYYHHRIEEVNDGFTSPIYARVVSIKDPLTDKQIIYLHADLGGIFHPLRTGLIAKIKENLYPDFDESCLMMTASHTHCGPSGLSQYTLYMAPTPGYNPELVEFICSKMYEAVLQSTQSQTLSSIEIKEGAFAPEIPVAFNRGLKAFNNNKKDIKRKYKREESNLALNRNMPLMSFIDENNQSRGFINWFGVHPIEVREDHNYIDGASKGYAAIYAESALQKGDVAIFAQGAAGDVMTSDFHNSKSFDHQMQELLEDSTYDHSLTSLKQARWNGQVQADKALEIRNQQESIKVNGAIDSELIYLDLSNILVDDEYANGAKEARTSSPTLGASFFTYSHYWYDKTFARRGFNTVARLNKTVFKCRSIFVNKELQNYRNNLYKSQHPKKIVFDGVEKSILGVKLEDCDKKGFSRFFFKQLAKSDISIEETLRQVKSGSWEEHNALPKILPIQIIRIGNIAIAGLPTEITTVAHNRLQATILDILKEDGVEIVLISSYANHFAGYTTTYEEYLKQRYEGGHTLYGKHQLGAFQTEFKKLAQELLKPKEERELDYTFKPPIFSEEELKKRSNLIPLEKQN